MPKLEAANMADLFPLGMMLLFLWIAIMITQLCHAWYPHLWKRYYRRFRYYCCCLNERELLSSSESTADKPIPGERSDSSSSASISMDALDESSCADRNLRVISDDCTLFSVAMRNVITQVAISTVLPVCHKNQVAMSRMRQNSILSDADIRLEPLPPTSSTPHVLPEIVLELDPTALQSRHSHGEGTV